MVLIMLVSYKCVCPGDLISANNAAIIRPPIGQWKHINNLTLHVHHLVIHSSVCLLPI